MKAVITLSSLFVLAPGAFAATAYSNFDISSPANQYSGTVVAGSGSSFGDLSVAFQFTAGLSGLLTSIDTGLTHFSGSPTLTLSVYSDSSNALGGNLGTVSQTLVTSSFNPVVPTTFDFSSASISLVAGQKYWVSASSPATSGFDLWNYNTEGVTGLYAQSGSVASEPGTQGAFQVNTAATPEPTSMIALGAGLVAIFRRKKVRN